MASAVFCLDVIFIFVFLFAVERSVPWRCPACLKFLILAFLRYSVRSVQFPCSESVFSHSCFVQLSKETGLLRKSSLLARIIMLHVFLSNVHFIQKINLGVPSFGKIIRLCLCCLFWYLVTSSKWSLCDAEIKFHSFIHSVGQPIFWNLNRNRNFKIKL